MKHWLWKTLASALETKPSQAAFICCHSIPALQLLTHTETFIFDAKVLAGLHLSEYEQYIILLLMQIIFNYCKTIANVIHFSAQYWSSLCRSARNEPPTTVKDKRSSLSFRRASLIVTGPHQCASSELILGQSLPHFLIPLLIPPSNPPPSALSAAPWGEVETQGRIKLASFPTFSWQTVLSRSERCHAAGFYLISTCEREDKTVCLLMGALQQHGFVFHHHGVAAIKWDRSQTNWFSVSLQRDWETKQRVHNGIKKEKESSNKKLPLTKKRPV